MDLKLFSLCKQETPETEAGKKCIFNCVKRFFPECGGFYSYSSQKRMLLAVSQSLRAADIVVVAVEKNMYNATKRLLCTALDMELEDNDFIAEKLIGGLASGKVKQATFDANIMFPSEAEIMPTQSGLNSGFALTSGGQHIIFVPLEVPRAEDVVFGSLYDYLVPLSDENIQKVMEYRHYAVINRTADKLEEQGIKAAVYSEMMKNYIGTYLDDEKSIIVDSQFPEREEQSLGDYCTYTSHDLRDRHHADYGIVFARPCADEKTGAKFINVTIADENSTNTVTVFVENNETDEDLFAAAVDRIMLMMYNYNELCGKEDGSAVFLSEDDKKLRRAIAVFTAVAVTASAVVGVIVSFIVH